jgi:hypothetical protein
MQTLQAETTIGNVIGHTTNGKPIYDSKTIDHKLNYSYQDHKDAAKLHSYLGDESHSPTSSDPTMLKNKKHKDLAQQHHEIAYEIENQHNPNRMWAVEEKYKKFLQNNN